MNAKGDVMNVQLMRRWMTGAMVATVSLAVVAPAGAEWLGNWGRSVETWQNRDTGNQGSRLSCDRDQCAS